MLNIKKNLEDEIRLYCKLNNIEDVNLFSNNLLNKAFVIEKYGDKPEIVPIVEKKVDTLEKIGVSLPDEIETVKEEPTIEAEVKKDITINEPIKKDNLKDDYKVYDF
jgi:hypothetical protein